MTKQEQMVIREIEGVSRIAQEVEEREKNTFTNIFKHLTMKTKCLYFGYFGIYMASWQEGGNWFFGIASEDKKMEKCWKYGDEDGCPFPVEDMVEYLIYPEYSKWIFEGTCPRDIESKEIYECEFKK